MTRTKEMVTFSTPTSENPALLPAADWQTRCRGDDDTEYQIYVVNAQDLGWPVKSYDEWLNS